MSEMVRVRLLLARLEGDEEPVIVAAVDETLWDHWEPADEDAWRADGEQRWGMDPSDCEWKEVWAEFAPGDLVTAFETPVVRGEISA